MGDYWGEAVVTVCAYMERTAEKFCGTRADAIDYVRDLEEQFGLEEIRGTVYRDASGGLVVITQTGGVT